MAVALNSAVNQAFLSYLTPFLTQHYQMSIKVWEVRASAYRRAGDLKDMMLSTH